MKKKMKSKLSLLRALFVLFKMATGKRANAYVVICHLSVIQTCVLASKTRCRHSFDCVSYHRRLMSRCSPCHLAIDAPSVTPKTYLEKFKVADNMQIRVLPYQRPSALHREVVLLMQRCQPLKKNSYENKIDRRRHNFWLDRISRRINTMQTITATTTKNFKACPFLDAFRRSQMIDF